MNFRKKIVEVWIPIHIYKFMLLECKWMADGTLNLRQLFYPVATTDYSKPRKYLQNKEKKIKVQVLMEHHSIRHQYAMIQFYDKVFAQKMIDYVDVRRDLQGPWAPLREFLKKYDIGLDEYDFDTAYKRYNREYRRKQNLKQQHEQHSEA